MTRPRCVAREVALVLAWTWAAAEVAPAAEPDQSLYGRQVVVFFPSGAEPQARMAADEADALTDRLGRELGVALDRRIEVVLCKRHADLERAAGSRVAFWVLGMALPSESGVLIKVLPPLTFRRVVRHEVVHLLVSLALRGYASRAPRWLHEGAAKYYAGDWSEREMGVVSDAARRGHLHAIADLAVFPTSPDEGALAYAESYLLIEYLVSLDPQHKLGPFLVNLRETEDLNRAFRRAYGLTEKQIEAGWHESMLRRSARVPVAWSVEATIFGLMVLIFLFALRRVRRRSREIRERMEEEELLDRLFRDV